MDARVGLVMKFEAAEGDLAVVRIQAIGVNSSPELNGKANQGSGISSSRSARGSVPAGHH